MLPKPYLWVLSLILLDQTLWAQNETKSEPKPKKAATVSPAEAPKAPDPKTPPAESTSNVEEKAAVNNAPISWLPIVPAEDVLVAEFEGKTDKEVEFKSLAESLTFCRELAKNLSFTEKTPGSFKSVICTNQDQATIPKAKKKSKKKKDKKDEEAPAETAQKPEASAITLPDRYWKVTFTLEENYIKSKVVFQEKDSINPIFEFKFSPGEKLSEVLKNQNFAALYSRLIIEAIPQGFVVKYTKEKEISFPTVKNGLKAVRRLYLYNLEYDSAAKIWNPKVVAKLTLKSEKGQKTIQETVYKIDTTYAPMFAGNLYFAQNVEGLNKRQKDYETQMAKSSEGFSMLSLFDKLILESLSSNYGGIRYAKALKNSNAVISKSAVVTAFLELRGGLLEGLRLYYETIPRVTDDKQYLEWQRLSLGYAFTFDMPNVVNSLISRIDIQPKIGLVDMDAAFALPQSNEEDLVLDFSVQGAKDFAVEIGTEKELPFFRTRFFANFSLSAFGISANKSEEISIRSARYGLDNYFELFKTGPMEWNGLLYGYYESLNFSKNGTSGETTDKDGVTAIQIKSLGFSPLMLGGGITVSW